jgi:dephospho-CoA kinase
VHRLLREDPEVHRALIERFGADVIRTDGADRAAIATRVFNEPDELDWLERLLHPKVVAEHSAWREEVSSGPSPPALTVTEIPLLYETGGEVRFDAVVVVTAPAEVRAARREVPDDRERRLLPDEEKVSRADYAYVNDGTLEELDAFVAGVVARVTA